MSNRNRIILVVVEGIFILLLLILGVRSGRMTWQEYKVRNAVANVLNVQAAGAKQGIVYTTDLELMKSVAEQADTARNSKVALHLAWVAMNEGNDESARAWIEKGRAAGSETASDVDLLDGIRILRSGKDTELPAVLARLSDTPGMEKDIHLLAGIALAKQEDWGKAKEALEQGLSLEGSPADKQLAFEGSLTMAVVVVALANEGAHKEAMHHIQMAEALDPSNPRIRLIASRVELDAASSSAGNLTPAQRNQFLQNVSKDIEEKRVFQDAKEQAIVFNQMGLAARAAGKISLAKKYFDAAVKVSNGELIEAVINSHLMLQQTVLHQIENNKKNKKKRRKKAAALESCMANADKLIADKKIPDDVRFEIGMAAVASAMLDDEYEPAVKMAQGLESRFEGRKGPARLAGVSYYHLAKYSEASEALSRALELDADQPKLKAFWDTLHTKPQIADVLPVDESVHPVGSLSEVSFQVSCLPLAGPIKASDIRLVLDGRTRKVSLSKDGTVARATLPSGLAGGSHNLEIQVTDKLSNTCEHESVFVVDNIPPVFKNITPKDQSVVNIPKPLISFTIYDDTGVDFKALNIELVRLETGAFYAVLRKGDYQYAMKSLDVGYKDPVITPRIRFYPKRNLLPGMHEIRVEAQDTNGEATSMSFQFEYRQ